MQEVVVQDQHLLMYPQRAMLWREQATLLIADPHFGKAASFRAAGIAVPGGTTAADLARLSELLELSAARRLIILGDFFHARSGLAKQTLSAISDWRGRHERLEILLVEGNHDRHAGSPPMPWRIHQASELHLEPPLAFSHLPLEVGEHYCLAGHLHPCVTLHGPAGFSMRPACFHFASRYCVLPAFGSFTGTHPIRPQEGDRVFVIGEGEVTQAAGE